ncbi:MAG TPA: amidohydrolase family protein [Casimicrobiaceae bacterium]
MRIDAHLHFWKPACGFDNKPVADNAAYRRDFLPVDVRPALDAAGIDAAILVQTAPQVAETDWLLALADDLPWIAGVTGWVDLDAATGIDVAALRAKPKLVGMRAQLRRVADAAFILRPNVLRSLAAILDAGLSVTMLAESRHYAHVADALERLPPGPVTLNHLGMRFADADPSAWRDAMRRFARRDSLQLQLSGLPFLFGTPWRGADAQQVLDDALDIFGAQRLMFASDWPMLVRYATYAEWAAAVADFLAARGASADDVAAVFGGNALRANPAIASPPRPRPPAG